MATFRLRRFSNPHTLRAIAPNRLLSFLKPYRSFFSDRGYQLPADTDAQIDYQALINIFMVPDESTPSELLNALYLVDEMSTHDGMDSLIEAADKAGMSLEGGDDQSPADIAIHVWLLNRSILERKHAEQFLLKLKLFEYYQTDCREPPEFTMLSKATRTQIEHDLDNWFESKKRGRSVRIFVFPDEHEVRILIRHGEPFKREESYSGTDVSSVCYRPLKYDVIVYDRGLGELRINARRVGEKKLYRRLFGKYLFRDENCFQAAVKYALEPLREYGDASLNCIDVKGVELIKLTEVHLLWDGAHGGIEIYKFPDVFATLDAQRRQIPEQARIVKANFKVKFDDSKTPRLVKIRPSNIAEYTRDADATLIEEWLSVRGFVINKRAVQRDTIAQAVGGS